MATRECRCEQPYHALIHEGQRYCVCGWPIPLHRSSKFPPIPRAEYSVEAYQQIRKEVERTRAWGKRIFAVYLIAVLVVLFTVITITR